MKETYTFEDAVVEIGDERPFYNCQAEIIRTVEKTMFTHSETYDGVLNFVEPLPDDLIYSDGLVESFEITVESGGKTAELEDVVFTSRKADNKYEFAARDGEITIEEPSGPIENEIVDILDDLASRIVDGNVWIDSFEESGDPHNSDLTTIKVRYGD
jgi:hypothetical protein